MPAHKIAKAFVAYSHLDARFRHELEDQLKLLSRKGKLEWWSEQQLIPGEEKYATLNDKLMEADLILLLISIHFLADDFCWSQQLKKAIERHDNGEAIVVPVFVRPCAWEGTPIQKLQGVPTNGKAISSWPDKHEGWTEVAREIDRALMAWYDRQQSDEAYG